jgi:hypothetical protein
MSLFVCVALAVQPLVKALTARARPTDKGLDEAMLLGGVQPVPDLRLPVGLRIAPKSPRDETIWPSRRRAEQTIHEGARFLVADLVQIGDLDRRTGRAEHPLNRI